MTHFPPPGAKGGPHITFVVIQHSYYFVLLTLGGWVWHPLDEIGVPVAFYPDEENAHGNAKHKDRKPYRR